MRIRGDLGVTPPLERRPDSGGAAGAPRKTKPEAADRVEISAATRQMRPNPSENPRPADPPRVDGELATAATRARERVDGGFYGRDEVLADIARRILGLLGFK